MPSQNPVLDRAAAGRLAAARGFDPQPPSEQRLVGIEMEWLTVRLDATERAAGLDATRRAAESAALPRGSRITYEPGGQVELSTHALEGLDAVTALAEDADALGAALARDGIGMVGIGLEPGPRRERALRSPRYDAMEAFFDASGTAGRTMMRSTAALQVNLDLGPDDGTERRWRLAHALGPVLAGAFANSPFLDGRPSGWRSTRLAIWNAIDPSRTTPVPNGVDCRTAWARYALAADVMLVRRSDDDHMAIEPGFSFDSWLARGHAVGWPTPEDLEYHLTTLFPPVRPRGWLELRMVDALPAPWWRVASAVTAVLLNDDNAAGCAASATAPTRGLWVEAARHGLGHPGLAAGAQSCFRAALAALIQGRADPVTVDATAEFLDRFVDRGRCPADDLLDRWHRDGSGQPPPDNA
jgi:glutamate--cysteine ligase